MQQVIQQMQNKINDLQIELDEAYADGVRWHGMYHGLSLESAADSIKIRYLNKEIDKLFAENQLLKAANLTIENSAPETHRCMICHTDIGPPESLLPRGPKGPSESLLSGGPSNPRQLCRKTWCPKLYVD